MTEANAIPLGVYMPARDIEYLNTDEWTEIRCPCGNEIQFSESGQTEKCECGRMYRYSTKIEVFS